MNTIKNQYPQLMCKDVIVAERLNGWQIYRPELLPHNLDFESAEVPDRYRNTFTSLLMSGDEATLDGYRQSQFITWLSRRVLSIDRVNAKKILNALSLTQNQSIEEKAKISLTYRAVSLCDSWWVKFGASDSTGWSDINLFENSLDEAIALIGLSGGSISVQAKHGLTAEISTKGSYAKGWFREGESSGVYLYKAGDKEGDEPKREVCASNIIDCFNVYGNLKYTLVEKRNPLNGAKELCSKCKVMSSPDIAIVHASELDVYLLRQGTNVIEYCKKRHMKEFAQMIVMDYLIANSDRHSENWGFYRDMADGKVIGLHPLYDHNNAFDLDLLKTETTKSILIDDRSMYEAAMSYLPFSELQIIKNPMPKMFPSKLSYETFVYRCSRLGLWQKQDKRADSE